MKTAAFMIPGEDMRPNQRSMKMKTVEKYMKAMAKTTTATGRENLKVRFIVFQKVQVQEEGNSGMESPALKRRRLPGRRILYFSLSFFFLSNFLFPVFKVLSFLVRNGKV